MNARRRTKRKRDWRKRRGARRGPDCLVTKSSPDVERPERLRAGSPDRPVAGRLRPQLTLVPEALVLDVAVINAGSRDLSL
jgi:hypothetical protein